MTCEDRRVSTPFPSVTETVKGATRKPRPCPSWSTAFPATPGSLDTTDIPQTEYYIGNRSRPSMFTNGTRLRLTAEDCSEPSRPQLSITEDPRRVKRTVTDPITDFARSIRNYSEHRRRFVERDCHASAISIIPTNVNAAINSQHNRSSMTENKQQVVQIDPICGKTQTTHTGNENGTSLRENASAENPQSNTIRSNTKWVFRMWRNDLIAFETMTPESRCVFEGIGVATRPPRASGPTEPPSPSRRIGKRAEAPGRRRPCAARGAAAPAPPTLTRPPPTSPQMSRGSRFQETSSGYVKINSDDSIDRICR